MSRAKTIVAWGMALIVAVSIWMGVRSSPIEGMAFFFILTILLWAIAKNRHWI